MEKQIKFWNMTSSGDTADIYIYGDIVGEKWYDEETSASSFKDDLQEIGDVSTIELHINSGGGSVFEGFAIFNMLKQNKATINVHIDGIAASIASVIAMAGDTISMPKNTYLMIHNASGIAFGTADEMEKQAEVLKGLSNTVAQTYVDKADGKLDIDKVHEMMDAETWLTAQEAAELGLADVVTDELQAVAHLDSDFLNKAPEDVKKLLDKANAEDTDAADTFDVDKEREYIKNSRDRANFILEEI